MADSEQHISFEVDKVAASGEAKRKVDEAVREQLGEVTVTLGQGPGTPIHAMTAIK